MVSAMTIELTANQTVLIMNFGIYDDIMRLITVTFLINLHIQINEQKAQG